MKVPTLIMLGIAATFAILRHWLSVEIWLLWAVITEIVCRAINRTKA